MCWAAGGCLLALPLPMVPSREVPRQPREWISFSCGRPGAEAAQPAKTPASELQGRTSGTPLQGEDPTPQWCLPAWVMGRGTGPLLTSTGCDRRLVATPSLRFPAGRDGEGAWKEDPLPPQRSSRTDSDLPHLLFLQCYTFPKRPPRSAVTFPQNASSRPIMKTGCPYALFFQDIFSF